MDNSLAVFSYADLIRYSVQWKKFQWGIKYNLLCEIVQLTWQLDSVYC